MYMSDFVGVYLKAHKIVAFFSSCENSPYARIFAFWARRLKTLFRGGGRERGWRRMPTTVGLCSEFVFARFLKYTVLTTDCMWLETEITRYEKHQNDRNVAKCSRKLTKCL